MPSLRLQPSWADQGHFITQVCAELIRKGEQEHRDDAKRAFDLTYGLIASEINAMVGQRFGPAESPAAAERLPQDAPARRLPRSGPTRSPGSTCSKPCSA